MPWLLNLAVNPHPVLVPEWMPDTLQRCLREGWTVVPDPRQAALPDQPAALPAYVDPDPEIAQARQADADKQHAKAVRKRNASARKWINGEAEGNK